MKILVCGGREYKNKALIEDTLVRYVSNLPSNAYIRIIQGGAEGADKLAKEVAQKHGWNVVEYGADWAHYGRTAGPKRNQKMLDEEQPDLVIVFKGGKGTQDMLNRARYQGFKVMIMDHIDTGKDQWTRIKKDAQDNIS